MAKTPDTRPGSQGKLDRRDFFGLRRLPDPIEPSSASRGIDLGSLTVGRRPVLGVGAGALALATPLGERFMSFPESSKPPDFEATMRPIVAEGRRLAAEAAENGERGYHAPTWIDYAGTANFAVALKQLFPGPETNEHPDNPIRYQIGRMLGGRGHIGATEYATLGTLLALKYFTGDKATRSALVHALEAGITTLGAIAASATAAEGIKFDVDTALERSKRTPEFSDKVALTTMVGSVMSPNPITLTVGTGAALTEEATQIAQAVWELHHGKKAEKDTDLDNATVQALIHHLTNGSGLVSGDPPQYAIWKHYGVKEGTLYMAKTLTPLLFVSLFSANYKINKRIIEADSTKNAVQVRAEAVKESVEALTRNAPVLTNILLKTFIGYAKASGIPIVTLLEKAGLVADPVALQEKLKTRDPAAIEFHVIEAFKTRIGNAAKIVGTNGEFKFPLHDDSAYHGLTTDVMVGLERDEQIIEHSLEDVLLPDHASDTDREALHTKIAGYLDHENYEGLRQVLPEQAGIFINLLETFAHEKADEYISGSRSDLSKVLERVLPGLFGRIYHQTNLHRAHNGLGGGITDVLDVFPFQAGSIPFLVPVFDTHIFPAAEKALASEDDPSMNAQMRRDFSNYAVVETSSFVMDNYVAADIGLSRRPDRPELIVTAAVNGGRFWGPANMADILLVDLKKYGLVAAAKQAHRGVLQDLVGFGWAEAVHFGAVRPGLIKVPEHKSGSAEYA
ncbi:MAG: hypothetical protein AAB553_07685 [Patescibacteria group bacterium]